MGSRGRNLSPWMGEHKQSSTSSSMAKLLDGVVFALSGFVNPERSVLRSQAMEMDAEYQTDWNPSALSSSCLQAILPSSDKLLLTVEPLFQRNGLLNVTKRRSLLRLNLTADQETTPLNEPQKPARKDIKQKPSIVASSESEPAEEDLSPAKVKKWAIDDLKETIAWLESQEERGIQEMIKQWRFIPRVVKELARLEDMDRSKKSFHRKDLCRRAMICKRIYETKFNQKDLTTIRKRKRVMER
ncbi:hypothetical protein Scep_008270 [Stephania cephalantha]|uniref:Uncharacterized protein n=1 Tax=Stephania cephalantha TaxID=152367 RepID=A0AAP0PLX2_9MAGN